MVLLRTFFLLTLAFYFISCAKVQYIWEQGRGQVQLMYRARPNAELLKDEKVPQDFKDKIKKIESYKSYFYSYFEKKPKDIYSKTTLLERKAVTYLVIASPYNEIKAKEECFPFVGCFPYLGFFKEQSAQKQAEHFSKEELVTWVRPVTAYSTLGHFSDPIISTFLSYSDYQLAETIFHELFHTMFWVKDEVELNENLAVYFSENLALEYFQLEGEKKIKVLEQKKASDLLMSAILGHIEKINQSYKTLRGQRGAYEAFLKDYLEKNFRPDLGKQCQKLSLTQDECWPLKREWNNASFAALLTYQKRGDELQALHQSLDVDLKKFFFYLQTKYDQFEGKGTFYASLFSH